MCFKQKKSIWFPGFESKTRVEKELIISTSESKIISINTDTLEIKDLTELKTGYYLYMFYLQEHKMIIGYHSGRYFEVWEDKFCHSLGKVDLEVEITHVQLGKDEQSIYASTNMGELLEISIQEIISELGG